MPERKIRVYKVFEIVIGVAIIIMCALLIALFVFI
jgi:hypothetical protein